MSLDVLAEGDSLNNEDTVLQAVPDIIKYGAMGLIGLIVIVSLWFIFSSEDDDSTAQTQVDSEKTVLKKKTEVDSTIPVYNPIDPSGNIKKIADSSDATTQAVNKQAKENKLKLTTLEQQLSQLIQDNNTRQNDQDQLIQDMQAQLTAQSEIIEQLQSKLKARQQLVKVKNKKVKRYRTQRLPFSLVSVDLWGNDLYAVVRSQGQLHEFTRGQGRKGWYVLSIDRPRRAVVFKNKSGARRELFVKS